MMLVPSGKVKTAGVIGWPVEHSLSPKLHGYWLAQLGIEGKYTPLAVRPDELAQTLKALPKMGFSGVNLTIPHKEAALSLLDEVDEVARSIGAVNTIVISPEGKLSGTNTDAYGFMENIRPALKKRDKAVVLGAGGASRAVIRALLDAEFAEIILINRTPEKAQAVAARFGDHVKPMAWNKRNQLLEGADLLVNTTSLGLKGNDPLDIDLAALPTTAVVNDIVYVPLITPLLEKAKAHGNVAIDGLGMLIHQAVPAFEAWFGKRPKPSDKLRDFLQDKT